jgi:hypothetical protein
MLNQIKKHSSNGSKLKMITDLGRRFYVLGPTGVL